MSQLVIMGVIENNHTEVSYLVSKWIFSFSNTFFILNVFKLISYHNAIPFFSLLQVITKYRNYGKKNRTRMESTF